VVTYIAGKHRQAVVALKTHNPGLDRISSTHFWPFATLVWVFTPLWETIS